MSRPTFWQFGLSLAFMGHQLEFAALGPGIARCAIDGMPKKQAKTLAQRIIRNPNINKTRLKPITKKENHCETFRLISDDFVVHRTNGVP
jgi:hypothetical protein